MTPIPVPIARLPWPLRGLRRAALCLLAMLAATAHGPARADASATAILQVSAPVLRHADGTPYQPSDFAQLRPYAGGSIAGYADSMGGTASITSSGANTTDWICQDSACPEQPFGFPPGGVQLPAPGNLGYAERVTSHMDNLMSPSALAQVRSDGATVRETGYGAGTGSGYVALAFMVDTPQALTLSMEATPFLHAELDGRANTGSYALAETSLVLTLFDISHSSEVFRFAPDSVNARLSLVEPAGGMLEYDPGTFTLSATTPMLAATPTLYEMRLEYGSVAQAVLLAVPEPAGIWLLAAGLLVLGARRRWRRLAAASLLCAGAGAAQAGAYATANLDIAAFTLAHPDGRAYDWSDFAAGSRFESNSLSLDAGIPDQAASIRTAGVSTVQSDTVCVPLDVCPAGPQGDYAYASRTAFGFPDPFNGRARQEESVRIALNDTPWRAFSQTVTYITYIFQPLQADRIAIDFDGTVSAAASLADGSLPDSLALYHTDFRLELSDFTAGIDRVLLAPGALNVDGLLRQPGSSVIPETQQAFHVETPVLDPEHRYRLLLAQSAYTVVNVVPSVPEPAPAVTTVVNVVPSVPEPAPAVMYLAALLAGAAARSWRRTRRCVPLLWNARPAVLNPTLDVGPGQQQVFHPGPVTVELTGTIPGQHPYEMSITQVSVAQVPEPRMAGMLGLGVPLVGLRLRQRRAAPPHLYGSSTPLCCKCSA